MNMEESAHGSIKVYAAGRDWELLRPADLESLWDSMTEDEFTDDERLPYWVELWPASIALADWVSALPDIKGKRCLDLGCGLGLTALAASVAGGRVLAIDYEEEALKYARLNAARNNAPGVGWAVMDWRLPSIKARSFDFIWGGDIMYERRFITPVLDCLEYALAPGGRVWLAEPNRNVYDDFRAALNGRGWSSKKALSASVDPLHVQKSKVSVSLWELSWAS